MDVTKPMRVRTPIAIAVVAVEFVVGVIAIVVIASSSSASSSGEKPQPTRSSTPSGSSSSTSPVADAQTAQIVTWISQSLPRSSTVLADSTVAAALRKAGFTAVRTPDGSGATKFVVSTPALRADAGSNADVARALTSSVPVALIGTGGDAVSVRQVGSMTPSQIAEEATTRRLAEAELLTNPRISASPQAAQILRDGGLDLRPASVLALLANKYDIGVVAIVVDQAEKAAGRPARIVDIRVSSAVAVKSMLAMVSPGYRLANIADRSDGVLRLTWPVDATSGSNQ